jgi:hypothetical protein
MNRRSFLRNLGTLVGALSVGLTVTLPQKRKVLLLHTDSVFSSQVATMVGHKGDAFLASGYVYAPYIPLIQTPYISLTPQKNLLQLS